MNRSEIKVIQLNGDNYLRWKYDLEITLKGRKLWTIITGVRKKPETEKSDSDYNTDMYLALKIISDSLSDKYHQYIIGIQDAKAAWEKINSVLGSSTGLSLSALAREYQRMELGESVEEYFSQLLSLVENQRQAGTQLTEEQIMAKIINDITRTKRYWDFCTFYKMSTHQSNFKFTVDDAEVMLLRLSKTETNKVDLSTALASHSVKTLKNQPKRGKRKFCVHCKKPGHMVDKCWWRHPELRKSYPSSVVNQSNIALINTEADDLWFGDTAASGHQTYLRSILSYIRKPSADQCSIEGIYSNGKVQVE